jgi:hypothetical protein
MTSPRTWLTSAPSPNPRVEGSTCTSRPRRSRSAGKRPLQPVTCRRTPRSSTSTAWPTKGCWTSSSDGSRGAPGRGRDGTAKLYRRSDREVSVSLPARSYDLAGDILAEAIDRSVHEDRSVGESVAWSPRSGVERWPLRSRFPRARRSTASRRYSRGTGTSHVPSPTLVSGELPLRPPRSRAPGTGLQHEPRTDRGLLDELGCDALEAVLDPEPGLCCVKARRI